MDRHGGACGPRHRDGSGRADLHAASWPVQRGTVRLGQADGPGMRGRCATGPRPALLLSLAVAAVVITVFLTWPEQIIGVFTDRSKPESAQIIAYGTMLLAMAALFQLGDAMQVMALGFLRALQDTKVPMILAAISYWVIGIPSAYMLAFPMGFGGIGLWLGLTHRSGRRLGQPDDPVLDPCAEGCRRRGNGAGLSRPIPPPRPSSAVPTCAAPARCAGRAWPAAARPSPVPSSSSPAFDCAPLRRQVQVIDGCAGCRRCHAAPAAPPAPRARRGSLPVLVAQLAVAMRPDVAVLTLTVAISSISIRRLRFSVSTRKPPRHSRGCGIELRQIARTSSLRLRASDQLGAEPLDARAGLGQHRIGGSVADTEVRRKPEGRPNTTATPVSLQQSRRKDLVIGDDRALGVALRSAPRCRDRHRTPPRAWAGDALAWFSMETPGRAAPGTACGWAPESPAAPSAPPARHTG